MLPLPQQAIEDFIPKNKLCSKLFIYAYTLAIDIEYGYKN